MSHNPKSPVGVQVTIPPCINEKMEAIAALAKSNYELARALSSINVSVTITGNLLKGVHTGIAITCDSAPSGTTEQ